MTETGNILSGMRPTGRLHMGHYSVLENWAKLQDKHPCYFFIADWHAITTAFEDPSIIAQNVQDIALDWLAAGLDPEKCNIFLQSQVKEHAELHLLFSMITPLSWLERVPTYKDQVQNFSKAGKDITTYGFLGYPLLMAADILTYRAYGVPVGEDQLPHIEFCRELVRRFHHLYNCDVFPEPKALLAKIKSLPGIDNRKMSKSYGNTITLGAETKEINSQVRLMITDPARIRKDDPGHPEVCTVYTYHTFYNEAEAPEICESCRGGSIGCVACKKRLVEKLDEFIAPVRERRLYFAQRPHMVEEILAAGNAAARCEAQITLAQAREAMGLS